MIENSSAKNIKIGAILTYITQFLSIAISFVYVPIMLGKLGQAEYGLYSIVQTLITYLQMSEMGIGTTATRYNSKYISENDVDGQKSINGMFFKLYLGIAFFCVVLSIVLYAFLDKIYVNYSAESVALIKSLFVIAVINLVITFVFKIFNAIIIAYEDFIFIKLLTLIQTVLGPAGMLAVLFLGFRSIGMLCVTTGLSLIFGLIQMLFCLNKYRIKFNVKAKDKDLFKTIFSFTIFVFINSLATQFMLNSDKIVISIIIDETAVAIYAIVIQFYTYAYGFSNVFSGFYLPRFTKIIATEKKITNNIVNDMIRIARIQVVVSGLIFGGFLAIGYPFIIKWVGAEYSSAYLLTVIVLFTEVIGSTQSTFNALMQAMNLHKTRALLSLIITFVKIVFTIIGTYYWGLLGCAIAFLIGWALKQLVFNFYYYKVGINIKEFWSNIIKILLPIAVVVVLLWGLTFYMLNLIPATNYFVILVYAVIYTILYIVLMWCIGLNANEKRALMKLLLRKKDA